MADTSDWTALQLQLQLEPFFLFAPPQTSVLTLTSTDPSSLLINYHFVRCVASGTAASSILNKLFNLLVGILRSTFLPNYSLTQRLSVHRRGALL